MTLAEQLKSQLDIVEVVGQFVRLKRLGSRWVGLSPFRDERTASFVVFSDHFHDFGSGEHGDVIDFVQRIESLTFPETVKLLAGRYGINIEAGTKPRRRPHPQLVTDARLFQTGLRWELERHLQLLKELFLLDEDAPESAEIRPLTKLLLNVRTWSTRDAVWMLRGFRRTKPVFVAHCIGEAVQMQVELAKAISAMASRMAA